VIPPEDRSARDVAVIDVGSNSVRLVLYRLEGRAVWQMYNEKVLAGLGRDMRQTGRLSPDGVDAAMSALRRFRAVLDGVGAEQVICAATAAVREAQDGPDFIARVGAETGLSVRLLSGEDEALFSARGVAAGNPKASGVVADLGGSSLELIRIEGGEPGRGVTLPLGPFALGAPAAADPAALARTIADRLAKAGRKYAGGCLHAVGGAWRNIALIRMEAMRYPLQIVHQFEMTGREATDAARFVAQQSRASLERMPGVSKKRAETLPYAALVLEALVQQFGYERVCMSAYGLREGLLLEALGEEVRAQDPLIAGCAAVGLRQGAAEHLGPTLQSWLEPVWGDLPALFDPGRDAVLLAAACRLVDMGARLHPDHRADLAFDQVLRQPIPGQSHPERAFLATALFARYTSAAPRATFGLERLLNPERVRRARAMGAAMRLGADLCGRSTELLLQTRLAVKGSVLQLRLSADASDLILGEQTRKRLASLGGALQMETKLEVEAG
jgi:exopolyphosphatase/guanosine-5'-triphosphate,3'-diphosphate pyrophosphatase